MLASSARPVFIVACACNGAFAILSPATHAPLVSPNPLTMIGGAIAFLVAATLGVIILTGAGGAYRAWIKAALAFLLLGPLAYWFLEWPAVHSALCLDCGLDPALAARALGDIVQSQIAMIAVALAALFCATRATIAILEELAA